MLRVVIWAFVLIFISAMYRVILNTWCLRTLLRLKEEHAAYLKQAQTKAPWNFTHKAAEIRDLFERAGVINQTFTNMEPVGYNHIQPRHAEMFSNIPTINKEIQAHVIAAFHEAIGVFEKRRRDAVNPLLWIETLLNLPASIIKYLGVKPRSVLPRLANVIVWICGVIGFLIELPAFSDLQATISGWSVALRHLIGL